MEIVVGERLLDILVVRGLCIDLRAILCIPFHEVTGIENKQYLVIWESDNVLKFTLDISLDFSLDFRKSVCLNIFGHFRKISVK